MIKNQTIVLLSLFFTSSLFTSSLFAADVSNFNRIQIDYGKQKVRIFDSDSAGFKLTGSYQFYDKFYIVGSYINASQDDDSFDTDQYSLGVGYIFVSNDKGSLFGNISYVDHDQSGDGPSADGYRIKWGYRAKTSERSELLLGVYYEDIDRDDFDDFDDFDNVTAYGEFVFEFLPNISAVATVETDGRRDTFGVGVRYSF